MNILVKGASQGIGRCIAEKLNKSGHNLFVTSRNETLLKEIDARDYLVCDMTKDINALVEFVKTNKIDVLINNAGEYIYKAVEEYTQAEIESIIRLNLQAPIELTSACVGHMKMQKWGRVINIGSISAVMGEAYASTYSATKAGLIGFTKALGLELAPYNITVNTINPGWVGTKLGLESIEQSEFTLEETLETIPQRRFVEPDEVASLVEYLISDSAKGITGQSINICAGLSVGI